MDNKFIVMLAFFLGYPAIWLLSFWLAASLGGWSELAEKYRCNKSFEGPKHAWQWGRFNWISYKNCFWIAILPNGLYIETGPGPLFKLFHPNLLIPWSAIKHVEQTKYWFFRVLKFRFIDSDVTVTLDARFLDDIQPFLKDKISDTNSKLIED